MKKFTFLILTLILILTACGNDEKDKLIMKYYYYPTCEGCTDGEGFEEYIGGILSDFLEKDDYIFELNNVADKEAYKELEKIVEENKEEGFFPTPPILIVGDTILFGLEDIEKNIRKVTINELNKIQSREDLVEKMENVDEGDSYFVYFYKDTCKYCNIFEDYLTSIDKDLTLNGGELSKLKITYVDIGKMENLPIVNEFYEKYGVKEEDWKVPMIFWKGGYLKGFKEIKEDFLEIILNGDALGWPGFSNLEIN